MTCVRSGGSSGSGGARTPPYPRGSIPRRWRAESRAPRGRLSGQRCASESSTATPVALSFAPATVGAARCRRTRRRSPPKHHPPAAQRGRASPDQRPERHQRRAADRAPHRRRRRVRLAAAGCSSSAFSCPSKRRVRRAGRPLLGHRDGAVGGRPDGRDARGVDEALGAGRGGRPERVERPVDVDRPDRGPVRVAGDHEREVHDHVGAREGPLEGARVARRPCRDSVFVRSRAAASPRVDGRCRRSWCSGRRPGSGTRPWPQVPVGPDGHGEGGRSWPARAVGYP